MREQVLAGAHRHSCFHCDCRDEERTSRVAVDAAARPSWKQRQDIAERAMTTGEYGAHDEWRELITHAKPIMRVDIVDGHESLVPESVERYKHCSIVTGVVPDPNPLWNAGAFSFNQMCRDDELHQMRLGMLPHIMAAVMSKITQTLHPVWAASSGAWPGVSGMRKVWQRLSARMAVPGSSMTPWVCASFARGYARCDTPL